MIPFILGCLVAIILIVIFGLITYARWNFGSLEKQGITVVQPSHWLLGGAMLAYEKNGGLLDIDNMKKYGPVFGLYEGREPQIFVCDAELIRQITTKDADHFDAKRTLDFGDELFNEMLDFQPLQKWRTMRSMFSPLVNSTVRLKNAYPSMLQALSDYTTGLKKEIKKGSGSSEGQELLKGYSLNEGIYEMLADLIARSQFGVSMTNSKDGKNPFAQIVKTLLTPPGNEAPWIATYAYAFPFIKKFLPNVMINPVHRDQFIGIMDEMMNLRRKQRKEGGQSQGQDGNKVGDVVDQLIEWMDQLETNEEWKRNGINKMTIYFFGVGLFIGGEDQISLLIAALMYYLSGDEEIRGRVEEEVDKVWEKCDGVIEHESLGEMGYLNACILEVTRLHPFFFRTERVCTKDWEGMDPGTKRRIQVKKGNVVQISIWGANRNPEYFEDAEEFRPERFLGEEGKKMHSYAFTSFGFGPRNCAGKKWSLEVMMLLAAYLVRELRFLRREDTGIKFLPAGPFFAAHEPVVFDVETRKH